MKLTAEIDGTPRELEIKKGDGTVSVAVDGRNYELEYSEPEPGVYLFKHDGRVYDIATGRDDAGGPVSVHVRGKEFSVSVFDPRKLRGAGSDGEASDGTVTIKTAMPGKVVRVLAAAGDVVEKGSGVVVVEAMKMQNELKSPKAGTVKEIPVTEGQTVAAGDVLAIIE